MLQKIDGYLGRKSKTDQNILLLIALHLLLDDTDKFGWTDKFGRKPVVEIMMYVSDWGKEEVGLFWAPEKGTRG